MRILPFVAMLVVSAEPSFAKECRMPDLPPGVHVAVPPECKDIVRRKEAQSTGNERLEAEGNAIHLGGGSTLKIGGHVMGEIGLSR